VLRDSVSDPQLQHKQGARAHLNNAVVSVALVERIMCRDQMLQVYNVGEKVLRRFFFLNSSHLCRFQCPLPQVLQHIDSTEIRLKSQRGKLKGYERPPVSGKHVSFAPAVLVALLHMAQNVAASTREDKEWHVDECGGTVPNKIPDGFFAKARVKELAQQYLEPEYNLSMSSAVREEISEFTLKSLQTGAWSKCGDKYLSSIQRDHQPFYALTEEGKTRAEAIKNPSEECPTTTAPTIEHNSSGEKDDVSWVGDRQIVLLVDQREGAGGRGLATLCAELKRAGITHETHTLPTADYLFVLREKGDTSIDNGMVLPLMVERKTTTDLAESIRDNRMATQSQKMRAAEHALTGIKGSKHYECPSYMYVMPSSCTHTHGIYLYFYIYCIPICYMYIYVISQP
jgi:hypothetical protein